MTNANDASIYEGKIDLKVKNNSHTIAYNLIADNFSEKKIRILEVGCNTGYLGEVLNQAGHFVFGVEISARAAALAASRIDQVFVGTIDTFLDTPAYDDERFDCITFGDVLEHLFNPGEVLQKVRDRLSPGGIIVASVPNITHLSVRLMLLSGMWKYSDRGILDRTHIRFFDKRGVLELFASAGYHVMSVSAVRLPVQMTGIDVDPAILNAISPIVNDDAADVFQYIVQARPGEPNPFFYNIPPLRVLILLPVAKWPIGEIRLLNPLTAWAQKYGGEVRSRCISDYVDKDIAWADIIILQREASLHIIDLILYFQKNGKAVIFDIDDFLTQVPSFLITYEHSKRAKPALVEVLRSADMVTTTTPRLAAQLAQYNSRMAVIPNCPLPASGRARHYFGDGKPVTILIASSDTVIVDFIVPSLRRLVADEYLRLQITAIGPLGAFLEKAHIPSTRIGNLSYQSFLDFIASHDNAIGIIPLDASTFSSCKSVIKFLDYGMCGVVSVCSNVPPYSDIIQNGVTGVLVDNDEDAWFQAIRQLALDPDARTRMVEAARKLCREHYSLTHAADAWQATITAAREYRQAAPLCQNRLKLLNLCSKMRDWLRLLASPSAYRSGLWILLNEGLIGIKKRINRMGL
jgi:SAM-dependent methyltransferase